MDNGAPAKLSPGLRRRPHREPALYPTMKETASLLLVAGSVMALSAAWYFQLVVGLAPCPLCLDQRIAYYAAVPLGLIAFFLARSDRSGPARVLLALLGVAMLVNAGIAVYHAGIEWQFWTGPTACTGAPVATTNVLSALKGARVPRCDEAAWRMFGLSMAGWNALIALALAAVGFAGATTGRKA